ncbi:restriction endonuclease subunit S [Actinomyces bouchesdurhonensis]|uniref:restriction endonuclease subunit S n=1 Tax=Actinomyces bouchesdurhonensis TaxID=1852361 RepID=UPI0028F0E09C|nr:restriction endonuclease subunit S [Actinomyces bouchesdurhonensis]
MTETLPEGWRSVPFWSLFYRDKQIGFPEEELLSVYREYGVIRKEDRDDNHNRAGDDLASYQLVEPGDLVLNKMKTWQGALGISGYRGIVSPAYFVYKSRNSESSEFLHYALRSRYYVTQYASFSKGVRPSQWDLQPEYLSMMRVLLPPLSTQQSIVKFLAQEIGEIDAMLAMLDDLNEALNSRRASVVERETIARSGSLTRLKFCADISLGKTFQGVRKSDHETLVNYVRAASIQPSCLELDDQRMWMTREEQRKYDLRKGDVLVVEGGAGFGRSTYLAEDMLGWGFQNHVIRVRPDRNHDGRFLNYCVKGHYSSGLIGLLADGATIPGLSSDKAKNLPIPDMSLEEQQCIADHLDEVTGRIDAMLATIDELKALLVERRAALITDVVTGRKKVPA